MHHIWVSITYTFNTIGEAKIASHFVTLNTHTVVCKWSKDNGKTRIVGKNIFNLKKSMEVLTSIIYHRADLYESYRKSTAQKIMKRLVYIYIYIYIYIGMSTEKLSLRDKCIRLSQCMFSFRQNSTSIFFSHIYIFLFMYVSSYLMCIKETFESYTFFLHTNVRLRSIVRQNVRFWHYKYL